MKTPRLRRLLLIGLIGALPSALRAVDDARDLALTIAELGAPAYATREAAQQRLLARGQANPEPVIDQAVAAYHTVADPEIKVRLRAVLQTLVTEHILDRPRAFLGVHFNQTNPLLAPEPAGGVQVMRVTEDSAAAGAGIQPGDLIRSIDDLDLNQPDGSRLFVEYIRARAPGVSVTLAITRGEENLKLPVTLGKMPDTIRQELLPAAQRERLFEEWLQKATPPAP